MKKLSGLSISHKPTYTLTDVVDDGEGEPLNSGNASHKEDHGLLGAALARAKAGHSRLSWSNVLIGVLLTAVVGLSLVLIRCATGPETPQTVAAHTDPNQLAAFLVVGDWGRRGLFNQSDVSAAMAARADTLRPQFVVSAGDNFYPHGLNSSGDAEFDDSFVNVYNWTSLQVPWYAVLGNHDYGDGAGDHEDCLQLDGGCPRSPVYQLGMDLASRDERWHCSRLYSLSLAGGELDLFFMDTSPFVLEYHEEPWAKYRDGIAQQSWAGQLRELEASFARSTAPWKLLVGHHPVRSNGEHGDTQEMRQHVQPLLEKYGVRAAFHGHDHDLEHIHVSGEAAHYFVTGAGSETRELYGDKDALFQYPASGFTAVTVKRDEMVVELWGTAVGTKPLYEARIPRQMGADGW